MKCLFFNTEISARTTSLAALALGVSTALSGCGQGTAGGPGVSGKQAAYGQTDDTFNLTVPMMSSSIKQGENAKAVIGINRAKNFGQDVEIKFADLPVGVTVEPANPVIKHGDKEAKFTFMAGQDSPVGDFKVKVMGHPAKGSDAEVEFKLTVAAKDSFTLTSPSVSSLKQGASQTASIAIKRDKSFDQDVALTFGSLPTGVTLDPAAPIIKRGEAEVQVTFTAVDNASLGTFGVKITGHPAKGADASGDLELTVVAK